MRSFPAASLSSRTRCVRRFLAKPGLSTEASAATNAVNGFLADAARLAIYGAPFLGSHLETVGTQGG